MWQKGNNGYYAWENPFSISVRSDNKYYWIYADKLLIGCGDGGRVDAIAALRLILSTYLIWADRLEADLG